MSIRVILAEDNYLLREGVRQLLELVDGVELVATCADLPELDAQIAATEPDVVVTDIRMPPTGTDEGIRAAHALRAERPQVGVVVLSQYAEPEYAVSLFDKGAAGRAYLLKDSVGDVGELVRAIQEVARGGSVIDPRVVEVLVADKQATAASPLRDLTPRERDVLRLLAEGRNNAGIGGALGLTDSAVEKHINSIFSKLGLAEETDVHRRVRAALIWLSGGSRAGQ